MKLAKEAIKFIGKPDCMGMSENLERIKILEYTPEPKNKNDRLITSIFFSNKVKYGLKNKSNFISMELEKKYLIRLNSMLSAKTEKTKLKRQISIISEYLNYPWSIMFGGSLEELNQVKKNLGFIK